MDPSGTHDMEYHHMHFTMPAELIDLANLSQDAIPGEFMLWLTDMGVGDLLPEGWVVDSVYWADGRFQGVALARLYKILYRQHLRSAEAVWWFNKGWREYDKRANW